MNPYGRSLLAEYLQKGSAGKAQEWIDETHVPNNAVLVIAGDIDVDQMKPVVRELFADWKRSTSAVNSVGVVYPTNKPVETKLVTVHRPGATQAQIRFGCILPAVEEPSMDVRHDVSAALLSERMGEVLRQQSGVTYGINAYAFVLRGGTAYLQIDTAVETSKLTFSLESIKKSIDGLAQELAGVQEVERIKLRFARRRATQFLSSASITSAVTSRRNLGFPLESLDANATFIASVTPEGVKADMRACLAGQPTLSIVGDEPLARAAFKEAWLTVATPAPAPTNGSDKP